MPWSFTPKKRLVYITNRGARLFNVYCGCPYDRTYRNNQVLYIRFYFFKMKDIRLLIY